eukprot:gene42269-51613_t
MSTVMSKEQLRSASSFMDFEKPKAAQQYMLKEQSDRYSLFQKLTNTNRRDFDFVSQALRSVRSAAPLTRKDEELAGALIQMGSQLEKIRASLSVNGDRVSDQAWAEACRLSEGALQRYLKAVRLAKRRLVLQHVPFADKCVRRLLEHQPAAKQVSYADLLVEAMDGLQQ